MDKWSWKMDWCRKNCISPASYGIWDLAEKAWEEFKRPTSN